jgi:hypothetical protein
MNFPSIAIAALVTPIVAFASIGSPRLPLERPSAAPITGAFGFKLGAVFTPDANAEEVTSSAITEKALPGALYRVTPRADQQIAPFDSYYILRTLKTHQIAAIFAAASPDCLDEAGAAQTIARDLAEQYSQIPTLPLQIRAGARQIVLQCTSHLLKLVYADVDLARAYALEAAEIEASEPAN